MTIHLCYEVDEEDNNEDHEDANKDGVEDEKEEEDDSSRASLAVRFLSHEIEKELREVW